MLRTGLLCLAMVLLSPTASMRITIKTLQNKRHNLDIEEQNTVAEIKQKIQEELKLGEAAAQKLIHHGKILKDDQTAKSAGFKENDFVVCMIKKVRKKKEPAATSTTQPVASGSGSGASASSGDSSAATTESSATLVTGAKLDAPIANLMGMGFDHESVVKALRAAYNNPDRAVEYLINGLPQAVGTQTNLPSGGAVSQTDGTEAAAGMQQMLHAIQQNPDVLTAMLTQVAQQNPQLFQQMSQNPNMMRMMLSQQMQQQGSGDVTTNSQGGIQLTVEEREAIENLKAMGLGFSEDQVIEAFVATGRDAEAAVNYLLQNYY